MKMHILLRRTLPVVGAALIAFSTGAQAQAPKNVLRVVPQSDITITDPLFSTAWISVIHGTMVWETLFAWDSKMQPKPQMVAQWSVSPDGLVWRFKLRDGLRFHDGSNVAVADVIASLKRWMAIDATAIKLAPLTASMTEIDSKTLEWRLSKPFPSLVTVLSAVPSRFPAVMRAKDIPEPGKPATTVIGSGPFRYNAIESVAGVRRVYDRNPDYVPRSEPADGLSGGRVVKVDRVEWQIIPDASTSAAALQAGEVDFMERPSLDLLPQLIRDKQIQTRKLTELSGQAMLRPNTLYPPFNDVRAREALAYLVDQAEVLAAGYGDERYWKKCNSFFICGSPNGIEVGAEGFKQDPPKVKKLLAEAGYKGETIYFHSTHELPQLGNMAEVVVDAMRKAGMNVELRWGDWATTVARSANRGDPATTGWSIYVTSAPGPLMWTPNTNIGVNMSCDRTNFAGWPCDEEVEKLRRSFLEAGDAERPKILETLHRRLAKTQPYRVLGQYDFPVAYRANLKGVLASPILVYWNITKE